ncbi:MAG: WD40 repeat domain-containing protein [Verrucomicrobiota bacterium]
MTFSLPCQLPFFRRFIITLAFLQPFSLLSGSSAQTTTLAAPPDIPALIKQLGSPYVRLRDEAEARLRVLPESLGSLRALVRADAKSEAGLRAAQAVNFLKRSEWSLSGELQIQNGSLSNPAMNLLRSLCASPDGTHCVAMFRWGAVVIALNPLAQERVTGQPGTRFSANWEGVRRAVAVSPDGSLIASGNDQGEVRLNSFSGNLMRTILPPRPEPPPGLKPEPEEPAIRMSLDDTTGPKISLQTTPGLSASPIIPPEARVVWGLAFLPGGDKLLILNGNEGLTVQDVKSDERRTLPFPNLRPRCLAVSGDGKFAAVGADPDRMTCRLFLVKLDDLSIVQDVEIKTIPHSVSLNQDGSKVLVAVNNGSIHEMSAATGTLRVLHKFANPATSVAFSADGKKLLATSIDPRTPAVLMNAEDGTVEWSAPSAAQGFHSAVWLDDHRFTTSSHDSFVRLWSKRGSPPPASVSASPVDPTASSPASKAE